MATWDDMPIEELEAHVAHLAHSLRRAAKPEMSRAATSVLAHLRDAGPQRITDLAAREAVAQPSMTTLVSRLERDGLAERRADAADRRAVLVAVTPEGERVLAARRKERAAALAKRLERLDATEREALMAALPALKKLNTVSEDSL